MINVIGLGYIGLPTALMMASVGNEIIGTDLNTEVVDNLNNGVIPFEEKGIKELYDKATEQGIQFTTAYQKADIYIVTVPTPYLKESKKIDPSYIVSAINSILDITDKGSIIAVESTVSPGTINRFVKPLIKNRGWILGEDIYLVHTPERILPGNMIHELVQNSRTVGVEDQETGEKIKALYETFCEAEIAITDIRTAEMSKVVENTFRDINIAFANELAMICRQDDLDVYEIIRIANKHPRVNILNPGPGVGGHCISVDPWFLVGDYPETSKIITMARNINDYMPEFVLGRTRDILLQNGYSTNARVGIYGLSYKPNVDDTRESPTLQLLEKTDKYIGNNITLYDPVVKRKVVDNQVFDFDEFLEKSDFVLIMVGHEHIKNNLDKLSDKIVLDTQNLDVNRHFYLL